MVLLFVVSDDSVAEVVGQFVLFLSACLGGEEGKYTANVLLFVGLWELKKVN
jgi:hypothetical protein